MISPNKKIKIALIGYRLSTGGAEKVMAILSQFFEKQGLEVHNIIVLDSISYAYYGKLVNLGKMKNASNSLLNKWNRFVFLKKYLDENQFDFIDTVLIQKRTVENSLGTHFFKKNDARARKINQSTYLILKKAIAINRIKKENKAVLKRMHFELILAFKTANYSLLLKYIILEIKLRLHVLFS